MSRMGLTVAAAAGACAAAWGARLTSQSYVQDGLVAQFDAIENVGVGRHENAPAVWKDLKGGASIAVPSGAGWIDRATTPSGSRTRSRACRNSISTRFRPKSR